MKVLREHMMLDLNRTMAELDLPEQVTDEGDVHEQLQGCEVGRA